MASTDSLNLRSLLKRGTTLNVTTDTPVAVRFRYVGTGTVTSVTVTTGTNIVFISSDGGTDTYAFATYTTVGSLVDAINKDGVFEGIVLDTLRASPTATQFVDGAITAGTYHGTTVWDMKVDTSAALYMAVRFTGSRGFNEIVGKRRVHLQELKYAVNMGTAAADSVQIWEVGSDGVTETKIYSELSVDTTATTISWASGLGYITSEEGGSLVCKVLDAATLADANTNYVRVTGIIE